MRITKREKLIYITLISLLISIFLLSIISDVYARYSSTITGSGNVEIAKWLFKVNEKQEGEYFDINIQTADEKIMPGSEGTFKLLLENGSNVPAQYTIKLGETFMGSTENTDALRIYIDGEYNEENEVKLNTNILQGKLKKAEQKEITLYWKWVPDEERDQAILDLPSCTGFTISAKVTGEQTTISEGEKLELIIK